MSILSKMVNSMKFVLRPSEERGTTENGSFKSFHTFSYEAYRDKDHQRYGSVRAINELRIVVPEGQPDNYQIYQGFEIFSYVISGELEHKDSLGNSEILERGSLQITSSGPGVSLCDDAHGIIPVHFLEIWSLPAKPHPTPWYFMRTFSDDEKTNKWTCVVAQIGSDGVSLEKTANGPAPTQSPFSVHVTILGKSKNLEHKMNGNKGYLQVLQAKGYNLAKATGATIRVIGGGVVGDDMCLREGDGAYISVGKGSGTILHLENVGEGDAEVLLIDLE